MRPFSGISLASLLCITVAAKTQWPAPINQALMRTSQIDTPGPADVDPGLLYPERNFSLPVDHFFNETKYEPHTNDTFNNRYWFDDTYYKPGGPVFLLIVGEADATIRLPILQKGIIYQLSQKYGGLGVVIEHRYFGTSQPRPDLSVENLRFLTTEQALEDVKYFSENIVFEGHENDPLTSDKTPWIAYGGSYSGAFTAFMRTLYPGQFWGTISSSGVTKAIYDYWEYYAPIAQYGPQPCISIQQKIVNMIDNIFSCNDTASLQDIDYCTIDEPLVPELQEAFGLGNLTCANDFAMQVSGSLGYWQSLNWDPSVSSPLFYDYCGNISSTDVLYNNTNQTAVAQQLLTAGGYGNETDELTNPLLNMMAWINTNVAEACTSGGSTLDQCYSTHNLTYYQQDDLAQEEWRSWPYMYCTQWGYLQTGSGVPMDQLPLLSRTINLNYSTIICRDAFNITDAPDTEAINQYGGYDIAYDRLAIIGGEIDPWRPATPLAPEAQPWNRPNNTQQPFLLIDGGVHHWDENGVFPNETAPNIPTAPVAQAQEDEHEFVGAWLKEAEPVFGRNFTAVS